MLRLEDQAGGRGSSCWSTLTPLQKKLVVAIPLAVVVAAAVVTGAVLGTQPKQAQSVGPRLEISACPGQPCPIDYHCRAPHGFCGEGPAYCNGYSTWTLLGCCPSAPTNSAGRRLQIVITFCTGEPCPGQDQCRSKFGFCGVGSSWCNSESTWTPACSSRETTPAPSGAGMVPTRGPTVQIICPTDAPTQASVAPTRTPTQDGATPAPSQLGTTLAPTTVIVVPAPSPSTKQIGTYFAEWGIYGRGFTVRSLHASGQAAKLTFINYAFANIYSKNGQYLCDASITKAESGAGDGGDQFAAYGKSFAAADSVDGTGDVWNSPLKGNFNQLKKLKAMYPNIKVMISLGGWSWSRYFSAGSATAALRKAMVTSCVDQYIKGNLPFDASSNAGGTGSALGVFDGIDIDWEYPGVQGIGYNTVSPNDRDNHVALFQEFRAQLDAFGATVGKKFYLTTAIGASAKSISHTDPVVYSKSCDWVNIMTYDYNGAWAASGPTDFHANLYPDEDSPNFQTQPDYNTDTAVSILIGIGVPKTKLNIGIPFYGRGWAGVNAGPSATYPGLYQSATGAAPGTYENGIEDYKVLRTAAGTVRTHPDSQQSYKYDPVNKRFWSYDTPQDVQRKVQYIKTEGLGGIFAWSADGDFGDELTTEMAKVAD